MAALAYARRGWHVFPVYSIRDGKCSCGKPACRAPGKHPRTKHGLKEASTDEVQIRKWWQQWPDANVAGATGQASGYWVLDVDPRNGGDLSFEQLGDTTAAVEQATGGGGRQLFYQCNGTSVSSKNGVRPGIDVKGDGGYVVLPPSNHISGGVYTWLVEADPTEGAEPEPALEGLIEQLFPPKRERTQPSGSGFPGAPPPDWAQIASQLQEALPFIDPDDRETWLRVGMGLKRTGGGELAYELWCSWSAQSAKYDASDQRRVWESINDDRARAITARSIFFLARGAGWPGSIDPAAKAPNNIDAIKEELDLRLQRAVSDEDPASIYDAAPLVSQLSHGDALMFVDRAKGDLRERFGKTDFNAAVAAERRALAGKQKEQRRADAQRRRSEREARAEKDISGLAAASHRKRIDLFDAEGLAREPAAIHDEAVQSLVLKNTPERIFRRGSHVWRLCTSEDDQAQLEMIADKELAAELLASALFIGKNDDGLLQPANPPRTTLNTILGAERLPFPELAGIVHAPVMRADGSVLWRPGYDKQSKLFYAPSKGLVVPAVSPNPTAGDVLHARQMIDEVFCQFPFKNEAGRANSFALFTSGFVQPAVQAHRPLCCVEAHVRASGKSLLVSACAITLTGQSPSITRFRADEEFEKKLAHLLQRGSAFILIDNVKQRIESSTLESILTSRRHQDRILGHNDRGFDVPQDAVWALTANHPEFGSEMARRSYTISLDPQHAHPEDRRGPRPGEEFKRLEPWVRQHRGRLIWAVLTLCRAWWVAGKPKPDLPPFGSFEEWQDALGGILQVAGVEGFLANRAEVRDAQDAEHQELEGFLRALLSHFGDRARDPGLTAAQMAAMPDAVSELPEEVALYFGRKEYPVRLGQFLRGKADRRVAGDGLRIIRGTDERHQKVGRWRVVTDA